MLGHKITRNLCTKFQERKAIKSPRKIRSKEGASKQTNSAAIIPLPFLDSDSSQLLEEGPCGLDLDGEMLIVKNAPTDYDTKVNGVISESFISNIETSDFANPESKDSRHNSHFLAQTKSRTSKSMMQKCSYKKKKRSKLSIHIPLVMRRKIRNLMSVHRQLLLSQFTRTLHDIKSHERTDEPSYSRSTKNGNWTVTSTRADQSYESASRKLPDTPMLSIRERPTIYYSLSEIVKYVEVMSNSFKSILDCLHRKEIVSKIDSITIKDQLEGYICFTHDQVTLLLNFIAALDEHQILLLNEEEIKHVWHVHDVITCLLQAYRHLKVLKLEDISKNHLTALIVLCAEVLVPRRKFPVEKWSRCMNRVRTIQTKMLENKTFLEVCQCRNIFSSLTEKNPCALCDCNVLFHKLCHGWTGSCKMEDSTDVFDDMIHNPQLSSSAHFYLEEFTPTLHWFSSNLNNVEDIELQKIVDTHNSQAFSCHPDAGLYACSKHRSVRVCRCFEEALQPMNDCSSLNSLKKTPEVVCSDGITNNKSTKEGSMTKKNVPLVTSDVQNSDAIKMALPVSKPSTEEECGQCQNNDKDPRTFVEHHSEGCAASNVSEKIEEKCITGDSTGISNRENGITSKICEPAGKVDQKHDNLYSFAQPPDSNKQVEMNGEEFSLRVSDSDSSIEGGGNDPVRNELEACQSYSPTKACSEANNDFSNINKKEDCVQIEKVISYLDVDLDKSSTEKTMINTETNASENINIEESDDYFKISATPVLFDDIYSQCGQPDPNIDTDSHSVHSLSGSNCSQSTVEIECVKGISARHSPPNEKQDKNASKPASAGFISSQLLIEEIPVISIQDTNLNAKCNENNKDLVPEQEVVTERERIAASHQDKTVPWNKVSRRMSLSEGDDSEEEQTKLTNWDKILKKYERKQKFVAEFPCGSAQKLQKHSQQMTDFSKEKCTVAPSTVGIADSDSSEILIVDSEDGGDSLQVQFSRSTEKDNNSCDSSTISYQGGVMFKDFGTMELSSLWDMGNIHLSNDRFKNMNATEKVSNKIQDVKDTNVREIQKERKSQCVSQNSLISNLRKEQKESPNTDSAFHNSGHLDQQSSVRAGKSKCVNSKVKQTRLSLKKLGVPNRTEVLDHKVSRESSEFFEPSDCEVRGDNDPSIEGHKSKTANVLEQQKESAQLPHRPQTKTGRFTVISVEQKHSVCLQKPVENCTLHLKEAGSDKRTALSSDKKRQNSHGKDQEAVLEAKQNYVSEMSKPESMEMESEGESSLIQGIEHPLSMTEQNQPSASSEEGLYFVSTENKIISGENNQENLPPQTSKMLQKPKKSVRFSENLDYSCDTKKSNKKDGKITSKCENTLTVNDSSIKSDQDHPFNKKFSDGDILEPCQEEVKKEMSEQTTLGTTLSVHSKKSAKLQKRGDRTLEMKMKTKIPPGFLEHADTDVSEKENTDSVPLKDVKKVKKKCLTDTKVRFADNVATLDEKSTLKDGPQHLPKRPREKFSFSHSDSFECSNTITVKDTSHKYNQNDFYEADTDEMFKTFLNEIIRVLDKRELKCNARMTQEPSSSDNTHVDLSILPSKYDETVKQPVTNQSVVEKKKRAHLSGGKQSRSDSFAKKRKMNQPREEHNSDPSPRVHESDSNGDKFQVYVKNLKRQFGVFSG